LPTQEGDGVPTPEYIAGFFDGEGCVHAYVVRGGAGRIATRISMSQRRRQVLDEIHESLGYGHVWGRGDGAYLLRIDARADVQRFIRLVYPHSVVKKSELKLAYAITEAKGRDVTPLFHRLREAKHAY
jgi:hypothetical protein